MPCESLHVRESGADIEREMYVAVLHGSTPYGVGKLGLMAGHPKMA